MRIVAGEFKGRHLHAPKGRAIRPTTDRVREAVFSILAPEIPGAYVLDLFAGTGALGLEAISRGASRTVFVDQSPEAVRLIRANVKLCGAADRSELIQASALQALTRLAERGDSFDLIFMDPPYGKGEIERALSILCAAASSSAIAIAEHYVKEPLAERHAGWIKFEERRYGDTMVSFLERELPC